MPINTGYYTTAAAVSYRDASGSTQIVSWLPLSPTVTSIAQNTDTLEPKTGVVDNYEKIAATEGVERETRRDANVEEPKVAHTDDKYDQREKPDIGYLCGQCRNKFF